MSRSHKTAISCTLNAWPAMLALLLASPPALTAPIVVNSAVLGGSGSDGSGSSGGGGGLSGMGGGSGGTGGNGGSGSPFADGTPGTAGSGGGVGGQLSGVPGGAEGGGGAGGYADITGLIGGGGGGGGGSGVVASGSTDLTNNNSIIGGSGGNGFQLNGVYGSGGGGGDGVTLTSASGSTIVNSAGATIRGGNGGGGSASLGAGGSGGDGISLVGDNSVITNAGTIQGGGAAYQGNSSGNAISLTGNNNRLELLSTSSISGKVVVVGSGNVLALIGSANGSFDASTLGSQYQGFTALEKKGSSTWTLTGSSSFNGSVSIDAGTLAISGNSLGSGALTFNGGTLQNTAAITLSNTIALNTVSAFQTDAELTLAGVISGTGSLSKQGNGNLILSGANLYSGGTTIDAGILSVNGSIVGSTTVNSGGVLGGSGSVGNVALAPGGILAPGNSIGTLTVNGDLSFGSGATYRVEIDPAGNSDKTVVNGNVTLAGTVDVRAGAGTYAASTTYTLLTHTGTRTGTFDSVTSNLAFLTPSLVYNTQSVDLTMARNDVSFASVAQTVNQRSAAGGVEALGQGTLYTAVAGLSAEQARSAFDALSGTQHAASSQIATNLGRSFSAALMNRAAVAGGRFGSTSALRYASLDLSSVASLHGLFNSPYQLGRTLTDAPVAAGPLGHLNTANGSIPTTGVWFQVLGGKGEVKGDGNGSGSDYGSTAFLAGYDAMLDANWLMGVAVGYGKTQWDAVVPATGNVDTPYAALYGRYTSGPWQVRMNGSFADNQFDTTRTVVLGATSSQAHSKHKGQEWSAAVEAEYAAGSYSGWEVRPLAAIRYAYLNEEGFSESGSAAALRIRGRSTQQANLGVGSRFIRGFDNEQGSFEIRAMLTHLAGDTDAPITASFVGQSHRFNVDGTPLRRTALVIGSGISYQIARKLSAFADLGYETRGGGQKNVLATVGVQYRW